MPRVPVALRAQKASRDREQGAVFPVSPDARLPHLTVDGRVNRRASPGMGCGRGLPLRNARERPSAWPRVAKERRPEALLLLTHDGTLSPGRTVLATVSDVDWRLNATGTGATVSADLLDRNRTCVLNTLGNR